MSYTHFKAALYDMLVKEKNCNVKFVCPDPVSKGTSSIFAHKWVLSLASDVFDTMFNGETAKHDIVLNSDIVHIEDIQMPIFKLFLSFIYGKKIELDSSETIHGFYYTANKYNCKDALEFIHDYMMKELKPENSIKFYESAHLCDNAEVMEACLKIFTEHPSSVINSPEFLSADPKTIETIFKIKDLDIDCEMDLIKALQNFVKHNTNTYPDIMTLVRPAINQIRFLTLTPKQITQTSLLSPDEALQVIASLPPQKNLSKMPAGLSHSKVKRLGKTNLQMVHVLSEVYTSKMCIRCIRNNAMITNQQPPVLVEHAIWNCILFNMHTSKSLIGNIFKKYNHVCLMEYDSADLKAVYDIYKKWGYVS